MLANHQIFPPQVFEQDPSTKSLEAKCSLKQLLADEIKHLASSADNCIFALYNAHMPTEGPVHFATYECGDKNVSLDIEVNFDFEGIGVWYICNRYDETYQLRHILVHIKDGRFVKGQVEQFHGYWDEFPQFIAEDRWIKALAPDSGSRRASIMSCDIRSA